jgi:hypothetical protein
MGCFCFPKSEHRWAKSGDCAIEEGMDLLDFLSALETFSSLDPAQVLEVQKKAADLSPEELTTLHAELTAANTALSTPGRKRQEVMQSLQSAIDDPRAAAHKRHTMMEEEERMTALRSAEDRLGQTPPSSQPQG